MSTGFDDCDAGDEVDAQLMAGISGGDHRAFVELHQRHQLRCAAVARRVLVSNDGVGDVLQVVFTDLWRQAARYDRARGSVAAWLTTATHHRAVDYVRQVQRDRARVLRLAASSRPEAVGPDPADAVLRAAEQRQLFAALATLAAAQREVLILSFYGGLTHARIAERTAAPLGTVKSRMRAGLLHLRRQLEADVSEDQTDSTPRPTWRPTDPAD